MRFNIIIDRDLQAIIRELGDSILPLEGKNILITGASGMLARYLVLTILYANKHLFKKPAQLYLVIRSVKEPFGKDKNIHYLYHDISKPLPKIKNIHYIVHAASKAAPKNYMDNMVDTLNTNILGIYNVLDLVNKNTKSILYFSSAEIYGSVSSENLVTEQYLGTVDHLNNRACYVEGKRAAETICMTYFYEKKYPIKIARIFHTFGPGVDLNDGRIFSDFIKSGIEKRDITIKGDKTIRRSFLYIKDATVMFFKILLSEKNGEVYNVGNEENVVSVGQFAKLVCKAANEFNKKKINVITDISNTRYYKHAVKSVVPDMGKFKKEFNYNPTTNIDTAIQRTMKFFINENEGEKHER